MRIPLLTLLAALTAFAQPRIDNVLVRMVPSGSTALVGGQIQGLLATPLYRRLIDQAANSFFDKFTADTGFDPRHDVRELLFATTPQGSVLLARGVFNLKEQPLAQATLVRHGLYNIWTSGENGLCILDSSLAAAGKLPVLEAALDEWENKGRAKSADPLIARLRTSDPGAQLWGVAEGASSFLSGALTPGAGSTLDFSALFRGLTDTWFQASFSTGLKFEVHGVSATVKDAMALRDAAKGAIGFGRLSVPVDKPELLPVLDGIAVEQQDRAIGIRIDLPEKSIDALVNLLAPRRK